MYWWNSWKITENSWWENIDTLQATTETPTKDWEDKWWKPTRSWWQTTQSWWDDTTKG